MKAKIRADLEDARDRRQQNDVRDQLIEALIEKNEIPVPPAMVKEQQQMINEQNEKIAELTRMLLDMKGSELDK